MSRLAELQQVFQQGVLDQDAGQSLRWISAAGRAAPERQLSAYTHAYSARLKEVLANDYPAVWIAIGDEAFDRLAYAYVDSHPSRHFSLREFGAGMAGFIAGDARFTGAGWLEELAAFEWVLGRAFDAADADVIRIEDMAGIPAADWPDLYFEIHPSVQCLDLSWNTVSMWQSLTADAPVAVTAVRGDTVIWLVWREQLAIRFHSLESDEAAALACVIAGGDFGQLCERLRYFVADDAVPLRAATLLKGWIAHGMISRIRMTPDLS